MAASPLNDRRIHSAFDSQLQARFRASQQPDFLIAYFVATRMGLHIQDNRIPGPPWERWGNIKVNLVTEGTLMVMFLEPVMRQEIWVGLASGEINAIHHQGRVRVDQYQKWPDIDEGYKKGYIFYPTL